MRRAAYVLVVLLLAGCGAASPTVPPPTPPPSATPASATPNTAATATRGVELTQIATLSAPTATVAVAPTVIPTQAPASPTPTVTLASPTNAPASPTPVSNSGGPILVVVTVQGSDPVNIRAAPDPASAVIALVGAGSDVMVMTGSDAADGTGHTWTPVNVEGRGGYIRSDLVGPRHVSSMPFPGVFPTPIFLAASPPSIVPPATVIVEMPPTATSAVIASTAPLREPIPGKQSKDYTGSDWLKLSTSDKTVLVILYTFKVPNCFALPSDTVTIVDLYLADHPEGRSVAADLLIYAALQSQGCVVPRALIVGQ